MALLGIKFHKNVAVLSCVYTILFTLLLFLVGFVCVFIYIYTSHLLYRWQ